MRTTFTYFTVLIHFKFLQKSQEVQILKNKGTWMHLHSSVIVLPFTLASAVNLVPLPESKSMASP